MSALFGREPFRRAVGGFPARLAGVCGICNEAFLVGMMVRYDDEDVLRGPCCAELEDDGIEDSDIPPGAEPTARRTQDLITLTMPRGASVAQRCPVCFQIPASNGTCMCN